jgi:DNA-binding NarL/FixJ family response regulator
MTRILLVDHHPIVRHGLRTLLVERLGDTCCGEAGDGATTSKLIESGTWDLLVTAVVLPDTSGLDLIKAVRRTHPALPALVLSMHPPAQFARRAFAAGATGYLTKDSDLDTIVNAIEQVRRGRRYVSRDTADLLLRPGARWETLAHEALSDREYQVLRRIGSGQTISQIGRELGLSVKTVSTYRGRILEKLGMHTNAELMRYAIENGLLDS